jgi:dTDP-4-dehydrorhamnose reductase
LKILVLGAGGQIGRAVAKSTPAGHQSIVKTRALLDIGDDRAVEQVLAHGEFNWIVNAAAYTAVDLAEGRRAEAIAVNDTAVAVLATAAGRAGARLLHLSTDFVFDGRSNRAYLPGDPTHPLSVYGVSKLGGEQHVLSAGGSHIVLRTAWVYAAQGRNFVLTMLKLMGERDAVSVVCDQIGTPTWATSVAQAIWGLIDADASAGIYHWTDLGVATWYDFAVAVQEEALARGLLTRAVPVWPIPTSAYPTPAQRPAFSVLNSEGTRALLKTPAQHWRQSLRLMLNELRTA